MENNNDTIVDNEVIDAYCENLLPGTLLQGGKYKIIRFIKSGGFGCTYEAVNTTWKDRRVAIKELFVGDFCYRNQQNGGVTIPTKNKLPLFEKMRRKFLEEADRINQLTHSGIVRVTDLFEENGTAYYVMDYIDGASLRDLVEKQGILPEQEALHYIRQVAEALQYVHGKKLLHLDIKPGNVMVTRESNEAILIDFGVAKQYDEVGSVNTSTLIGYTEGYAPTEQMGREVREFGPATDIYSLGATLYTLLTGVVPPSAGMIASGVELPPLPSKVSATTRRAVAAAMQIKKQDRPQTVAEFLALLNGKARKNEPQAKPSPLRWLWIALVGIVIGVGVVVGMRGCQPHAGGEPDAADSTALVDTTINTDEGSDAPLVREEPNTREETTQSSDERRDAPPVRETADDAEQTRLAEENLRLREKIRKDSIEAAKKAEAERIAKEIRQAQNENISKTLYEGSDAPLVRKEPNTREETTQLSDERSDAPSVRKTAYDTEQERWQNLIPVVYVSGGTYTMGATSEQGSDADSEEKPTHQVTVSSFYMGKYEVTQAQWEAVMGSNPSKYKGSNLPVEQVSYEDAVAFCRKLSTLTGRTYRLPTEAEWEYAARGGNQSRGYKYSGSNDLGSVAWYEGNSGGTTHAVGTKRANELGLYDMSGNVREWCSDWYGDYSTLSQTNPKGPNSGQYRVLRGGGWGSYASYCRVSFRDYGPTSIRYYSLGFRVVLEP